MFSYTFLYLFSFLVPGYLLAHLLRIGRLAGLLCLPLSYMLLVASLLLTKAAGAGVAFFSWILVLEFVLICLGVAWRQRSRSVPITRSVAAAIDSTAARLGAHKQQIYLAVPLFAALSVYFYWVGPYTETPSDFWSHVGSIQQQYLSLIEHQAFPPATDWRGLVGKEAEYWYSIQAFLCYAAGISVEQSFGPQAFVNSLIILSAVFGFTLLVLRGSGISDRGRCIVAVIATGFFLTAFGTNVFSFVRYYTFGPVFLNYVVYLLYATLAMDFLGRSEYPKPTIALLLFALLVLMAMVHVQEAVFAITLGIAMLSYTWFRVSVAEQPGLEGCSQGPYGLTRRQLDLLFYLTAALVAVAMVVARIKLQRHDPLAFNRMIDLSEILPFVRHMYILDPQQQFYDALAPWGFLVLLLFVLHWRRFAANPVLVAGMLSPFYTVLNPVFTDFFLRLSWPELVWRFLYMAPTAIAGALVAYQCGCFIARRQHVAKMLYGLTVISMLIVLLFPLDTTYFNSPFSKLQTLKKVPAENDHRVWQDLYAYLRTLDKSYNVLTDPVTGYMLKALTQHTYLGAKFHTIDWGGYQQFNFKKHRVRKYGKYDGWLFVINQRDGALSETGRISRHWGEVQLQLHRYYLGGLAEFVNANPAVFEPMWARDGVAVYKIRTAGISRNSDGGNRVARTAVRRLEAAADGRAPAQGMNG